MKLSFASLIVVFSSVQGEYLAMIVRHGEKTALPYDYCPYSYTDPSLAGYGCSGPTDKGKVFQLDKKNCGNCGAACIASAGDACGCLNPQGWGRAYHLIDVFNNQATSDHRALPRPGGMFANNYAALDGGYNCERCLELAMPLANHLNLTINHTFGGYAEAGRLPPPLDATKGNGAAAKAILEKLKAVPERDGFKSVLTVWESWNIRYLTAELMGANFRHIPLWDYFEVPKQGRAYDYIYILKFDDDMNFINFAIERQGFTCPETEGCPDETATKTEVQEQTSKHVNADPRAFGPAGTPFGVGGIAFEETPMPPPSKTTSACATKKEQVGALLPAHA